MLGIRDLDQVAEGRDSEVGVLVFLADFRTPERERGGTVDSEHPPGVLRFQVRTERRG